MMEIYAEYNSTYLSRWIVIDNDNKYDLIIDTYGVVDKVLFDNTLEFYIEYIKNNID